MNLNEMPEELEMTEELDNLLWELWRAYMYTDWLEELAHKGYDLTGTNNGDADIEDIEFRIFIEITK